MLRTFLQETPLKKLVLGQPNCSPPGGGGTSISDQSETCLSLGSPFSAKIPEQDFKFR